MSNSMEVIEKLKEHINIILIITINNNNWIIYKKINNNKIKKLKKITKPIKTKIIEQKT